MPNMPEMDKEPEVDPMGGETKPRRTPSGRFKRARTRPRAGAEQRARRAQDRALAQPVERGAQK
jgi:hypothetical protein